MCRVKQCSIRVLRAIVVGPGGLCILIAHELLLWLVTHRRPTLRSSVVRMTPCRTIARLIHRRRRTRASFPVGRPGTSDFSRHIEFTDQRRA